MTRSVADVVATHYHEMTDLAHPLRIVNLNVAVREWNDEVTFFARSCRGQPIKVGIRSRPRTADGVLHRAKEILNNLESRTQCRRRAAPGWRTRRLDGFREDPPEESGHQRNPGTAGSALGDS